ncbi:MAG: ankyrin repeat domain-containing protein [Myxococcota bacterium]|nr:ankyrin repeat domain-containing protein [Myxococcota bacterium]
MAKIDALRRAVAALDVPATESILATDPDLLRQNPEFSAQLLSLAIRMISYLGDQGLRAPLHVAVQMTHPVLAEELLARGADPNREIIGLSPARINPDPAFLEVLRRFGASDA